MKKICLWAILCVFAGGVTACDEKEEVSGEETSVEYVSLPGDYQAGGIPDALAEDCLKLHSPELNQVYTGRFVLLKNVSFRFYKDESTIYGLSGTVSWDKEGLSGAFAVGRNAGSALKMDRSGYFLVELNTVTKTGSISKAGWEVIGDATPGGSESGTVMDYDPRTKLWSLTVVLKDGKMKFRKDGDWNAGDLGGTPDALSPGGAYMEVKAGTYDIVLDPEACEATLTKQEPNPEPQS